MNTTASLNITTPSHRSDVDIKTMANAIRFLSMDAVEKAKSGHPGMPMGMADVATVLFTRFLKFDPRHPNWPDRDRFILSAGHGSMLLYSLLYLTGYEDMTIEDIKQFRQLGAKTAGHPEYGHASGIETTTGPLGQGIATAVGMALGERMMAARFGESVVDHYTYVIAGDGCLMEGISQEAISMAGHLKLNRLIVLWDDNDISIDGKISLSSSDNQKLRFEASGWDVQAVDGHDPEAVATAIEKARHTSTPSLIACKTTIGYGSPNKAGTSATHGAPLGADEIAGARKALGWDAEPFNIPENILSAWREAGSSHHPLYTEWTERLDALPVETRTEFERILSGELPEGWNQAIDAFKEKASAANASVASRKSSQDVLDILTPAIPEMIGGSADLTGSNNTKTGVLEPIQADHYDGRYIYYGIREHGMAAVMNGLALHGGAIPYGGTFLIFSDYCRPAIRLSALMEQRVIYVLTHDSIGLGEDGPTHQPVEHIPSLRAIPNLQVFRPADAVETAECWALALASPSTPSILALSRQNLPTVREEHTVDNLCARGGYILRDAEGGAANVVILATGSEISLAMEAREQLQAKGTPTRVVSMPCWELFDQQPESYRREVLGENVRRIAVEAALGMGWEKYLGENGTFIGMKGFGASAPAPDLYKHFGITVQAVVDAAG